MKVTLVVRERMGFQLLAHSKANFVFAVEKTERDGGRTDKMKDEIVRIRTQKGLRTFTRNIL
jgi:hypothetical protein